MRFRNLPIKIDRDKRGGRAKCHRVPEGFEREAKATICAPSGPDDLKIRVPALEKLGVPIPFFFRGISSPLGRGSDGSERRWRRTDDSVRIVTVSIHGRHGSRLGDAPSRRGETVRVPHGAKVFGAHV